MGLQYSESLGRKLRKEPWPELGVSNLTRLLEAIEAGRDDEAIELLEYHHSTGQANTRFEREWVNAFLTDMAREHGEDVVYQMWRYAGRVVRPPYERVDPDLAPAELLTLFAEMARALETAPIDRSTFEVVEEPDRYVVRLDTCPSGAVRRSFADTKPHLLGRTKEPHDWSWGRIGVPYACTHCAIVGEIMAIEQQGYPAVIADCPDDDGQPCRRYIYKRPEAIPETYFERVGFKKDPTKFRKMSEADAPLDPVTLVSW